MSRLLAQQVGHGADVVLVAVGEHDAVDVVEAVPDVVEVGQDQVDAGLEVLGEQHAAVDDQQPAGVLEDGHVAADLAEPAERDDAQAAGRQLRRRAELGVRVAHERDAASARRARRAARRHLGRRVRVDQRRSRDGARRGSRRQRAARPWP